MSESVNGGCFSSYLFSSAVGNHLQFSSCLLMSLQKEVEEALQCGTHVARLAMVWYAAFSELRIGTELHDLRSQVT